MSRLAYSKGALRFVLPTLLMFAGLRNASAQEPTADGFNPYANGAAYALAVQPDGSMLIGGNFTWLGGPNRFLARFGADGTLDSSFNPVLNGGVSALAVQADGSILVGGAFTQVGGENHVCLGRLFADGTVDSSFSVNANAGVNAFALQADGKVLVGGGFSTLNGTNHTYLARLNADGTVDTNFNPVVSGGEVETVAVQADGKILVGGWFWSLGNISSGPGYLGRLQPDGSLDAAFTPHANYAVETVAVQADGKILAGGWFSALGGLTRYYLGRLETNGTLDATFDPEPSDRVYALALQADGMILIGGSFSSLSNQPCMHLGRLDTNGVMDASYHPVVDYWAAALALQQDGKVLVGGLFNSLGGQSRMNCGRLNSAGLATETLSYDGATITWQRGGTAPEVWHTTFEMSTNGSDWSMLGAGTRVAGVWQLGGLSGPLGLIRARGYTTSGMLNGSGGIVESLMGLPLIMLDPVSGMNNAGETATFSVAATGSTPFSYQWRHAGVNLVDGGAVDGATAQTVTLSGVLGGDAGGYDVIVSNVYGCVTSTVATLTVIDPYIVSGPVDQAGQLGVDYKFYVDAAGTALTYQWRKDGAVLPGATDASLPLPAVQAVDAGGYDVVVSSAYGCVTSAVAVLSVNVAVLDPVFNAGMGGNVNALAVQADGKVLVGGSFWRLGGAFQSPPSSLVRLNTDGSVDASFNAIRGFGMAQVNAVAVQADGKILVGGMFETMGGLARKNIARLNADGTADPDFAPDATGTVYALAVQPDGGIVVGGSFDSLGGATRANIGRLDAQGIADELFDPGAYGQVQTLALQADGRILVGGSFDTLGGDLGPSRLGRLNADGTLDADFNPGVSSAGYCTVSALAVQADGRILVGGQFDTLGGSNRNDIGRLETNGVVDATFDPNADGAVFSLALQADGKILVAGGFWSLNGVSRYRGLARLAADGTPDPFVTPEAGYTKALAVQADGRVLVGGSSWSLNNVQIGCLGRLENTEAPTETIQAVDGAITWMRGSTAPEVARTTFECTTNGGSLWTMMGTGVRVQGGWRLEGGSEPLGTVRARGYTVGGGSDASSGIIESGLGAPVIEGEPASCTNGAGSTAIFTVWAVGSAPFSCTWRKNGVTLTDGAQVTGTTTTALSLNGVFGSDAGGYDVIVRNADGCVTSTVAVLTVLDPAITQQPFTQNSQLGDSVMFKVSAKGTGLSYQWWKDGAAVAGATDTTFNVDSVQASDVGYYDVVVHGTYGSVTSSVAAIEVNLVFGDTSFQPDPNGLVRALAVQPDGKILLGGGFMTLYADTVSRLRLARMNANGTLDDTFDPGAGDVVHALAVQADGGILVGGEFGTLGGLSCKCFGRLGTNGLLQAGAVPEADGSVNALVVQADGSVLLGGDFTTLDVTNSCNHLARLLPDGTLDTAFDPGADQPVCVLAVQADGCILVGGSFSTLGGSGHIGLGRLTADGVIDDTFNPVVDGQVQAVAVQADGKILVGGNFGTVNTTNRINIARLNQDGSLDESFDPGASGQVDTLVLQANGKILVGGSFYVIGNEAHPYLARLNTDGTPDAAFGPYVDSEVNALCLQADGGILAGGWFNGLADVSSPRVGRLCNTEPAIGTLTNNGATVTWLRGGAAPEAWQTTFEATTNGVDWTPLGFGMRIAGGWQLTGVQAASAAVHTALVVKPKTAKSGGTIATGTIIRARAYLSCGMWNGSGGIVETCLVVSAPSPMADSDGDGIPDSWTLQYFGHSTGQTGDLSCAVCDADGTGQNNLFKYVAGLDPTNSASVFRLDIKNVTGEATQKRLTFSPRWSDRIYTLQFCTNLTLGVPWADLTTAPANDNGDERTVTDQGATDASRFYRIQITLP